MPLHVFLRQVLGLLAGREKRALRFWTSILSATSALDLLGVLLIGSTFYVASNKDSYRDAPFIANAGKHLPFLLNSPTDNLILFILILSLFVFMLKSFSSPLLYKFFYKTLNRITDRISSNFTTQVLNSKPNQLSKYSKQEIIFILGDGINNTLSQGIGAFVVVFSESFLLVSLLGLLLIMNPILTLSTLIYFGVVFFSLNAFMKRKQNPATRSRIKNTTGRNHSIAQSLSSLREIQLSGTTDFYQREYSDFRSRENASIATLQYLNIFPKYFMEFCMVLGISLLGLYVFLFPSKDAFLLLALFSSSSTRILPSILRIQFSWSVVQSGLVNAETALGFFNSLSTQSSILPSEEILQENENHPFEIEFKQVCFKYAIKDEFSISGVNLSVGEYQSLAIVGRSGSGKSTLIEMLIGNLIPDSGSLTIGNRSVHSLILSKPGAIGLVPQEIPIFNRSVAENIALGISLDSIDAHLIESLLAKVGLLEFVQTLPDGIYTVVGDSGVGLSGGQRQRIGIARALYYSPKILIFDEATSSLDAESEHLIASLLNNKSLNCTKIVVAHRLSSIRSFERIAYLESGRIVEVGSFSYLRGKISDFDDQARLLGL